MIPIHLLQDYSLLVMLYAVQEGIYSLEGFLVGCSFLREIVEEIGMDFQEEFIQILLSYIARLLS